MTGVEIERSEEALSAGGHDVLRSVLYHISSFVHYLDCLCAAAQTAVHSKKCIVLKVEVYAPEDTEGVDSIGSIRLHSVTLCFCCLRVHDQRNNEAVEER